MSLLRTPIVCPSDGALLECLCVPKTHPHTGM
jgi:hypothetical protein